MRSAALDAARLDERRLRDPRRRRRHGLHDRGDRRARRRRLRDDARPEPAPARAAPSASPRCSACAKVLGDAEALPLPTDHFDRYVSAGSIEYWPEPERGIAEAYRVLRPAGWRSSSGRCRPATASCARLAELWMLFPTEDAVPRVVRARRLHGRRARHGRARLVPRPPQPLRGRGQRPQARAPAPSPLALGRRGRGPAARRWACASGSCSPGASCSARWPARCSCRSGSRSRCARGCGGAEVNRRRGRRAAPAGAGGSTALWRFSRPHTVIGTAVSVVGLYVIAVDTLPGLALGGRARDLVLDAASPASRSTSTSSASTSSRTSRSTASTSRSCRSPRAT